MYIYNSFLKNKFLSLFQNCSLYISLYNEAVEHSNSSQYSWERKQTDENHLLPTSSQNPSSSFTWAQLQISKERPIVGEDPGTPANLHCVNFIYSDFTRKVHKDNICSRKTFPKCYVLLLFSMLTKVCFVLIDHSFTNYLSQSSKNLHAHRNL